MTLNNYIQNTGSFLMQKNRQYYFIFSDIQKFSLISTVLISEKDHLF